MFGHLRTLAAICSFAGFMDLDCGHGDAHDWGHGRSKHITTRSCIFIRRIKSLSSSAGQARLLRSRGDLPLAISEAASPVKVDAARVADRRADASGNCQ